MTIKEETSKQLYLDLFVSRSVLIPVFFGLQASIFGWLLGSMLTVAGGFLTALFGLGIFGTRLVFGLDKLAQEAQQKVLERQEQTKEQDLDNLIVKLKRDRDPRPERCLQELRSLRKLLKTKVSGTFKTEILDNFDDLFKKCVKQITDTDELWSASLNLTGRTKKKIREEREKIVLDVEELTNRLVDYVHKAIENVDDSESAQSLKELEQSIEIARKTEQRLSGLTDKIYDPKEFE